MEAWCKGGEVVQHRLDKLLRDLCAGGDCGRLDLCAGGDCGDEGKLSDGACVDLPSAALGGGRPAPEFALVAGGHARATCGHLCVFDLCWSVMYVVVLGGGGSIGQCLETHLQVPYALAQCLEKLWS